MTEDRVDGLLRQWGVEHPEKDTSALGVVVRIQMLAKRLQRQTTKALGQHGLKHWEYDVLSVLRRQGVPFELTATDIAQEALLTAGAMTTRIDGLELRGLVRRKRNHSDGRSVTVRLTAKGKRAVDAAIDSRIEAANRSLDRIDDIDERRLADGLRSLLIGLES